MSIPRKPKAIVGAPGPVNREDARKRPIFDRGNAQYKLAAPAQLNLARSSKRIPGVSDWLGKACCLLCRESRKTKRLERHWAVCIAEVRCVGCRVGIQLSTFSKHSKVCKPLKSRFRGIRVEFNSTLSASHAMSREPVQLQNRPEAKKLDGVTLSRSRSRKVVCPRCGVRRSQLAMDVHRCPTHDSEFPFVILPAGSSHHLRFHLRREMLGGRWRPRL